MTTARLLAFAATALVIIVIPGPSVLFIVGRALSSGRRVALLSVLGNTAGEYVQVLAVAFGVGALAERSVAAFDVTKLLGAGYLVYLGIKAVRDRRSLAAALAVPAGACSSRRCLLEGAIVGVSNPKTVIFLAAILPQFVDRTDGGVPGQILLLGLVFAAIAIISDSVWALGAGAVRSWLAASPRRLELLGGAGGIAIVAVGVRLALTGRHD